MKLSRVLALTLLLGSALVGCSESKSSSAESINGEYNVNKVCDTSPGLTITKIEVTKDETIIHFHYKNLENAIALPRVHPPGQREAFYIIQVDGPKKFLLRNVGGIAIHPAATEVKPGDSLDFTLRFERIDDSMRRFHLIEGEAPDPNMRQWNFLNVDLKAST